MSATWRKIEGREGEEEETDVSVVFLAIRQLDQRTNRRREKDGTKED